MSKSETWTVTFGVDCFSIVIRHGLVVEAPGFARAMIGKTKAEAKRYIYMNDGRYECLMEPPKDSSGPGVSK